MPRFQHGVWAGNPGKPTTSIEGNDDTTSYLYFPVINHKLRKAIVGWSSWSQVDGNWQKAFLWWGANRWFSLLFQDLHNPKISSFFFALYKIPCTPKRRQIRSPGEWLRGVLGSLTKPWRASVRPDTGGTPWVTRNGAAVGGGRLKSDCCDKNYATGTGTAVTVESSHKSLDLLFKNDFSRARKGA